MHTAADPEHPTGDKAVHAVETFEIRLGIPLVPSGKVFQVDRVMLKIDRMQ